MSESPGPDQIGGGCLGDSYWLVHYLLSLATRHNPYVVVGSIIIEYVECLHPIWHEIIHWAWLGLGYWPWLNEVEVTEICKGQIEEAFKNKDYKGKWVVREWSEILLEGVGCGVGEGGGVEKNETNFLSLYFWQPYSGIDPIENTIAQHKIQNNNIKNSYFVCMCRRGVESNENGKSHTLP